MVRMDRNGLVEAFKKFFNKNQIFNFGTSKNLMPGNYTDLIYELANEYPDSKSLEVHYKHIEDFSRILAKGTSISSKQFVRELITNPELWLEAATIAIGEIDLPCSVNTRTSPFEFSENEDEREDYMKDVIVRVVDMPEEYIVPISELRNEHIGKFLSVVCTVSKATDPRPRITKAVWKCMRCSHEMVVYQDIESNSLQEPFAGCENDTCGKKGPFKLLKTESEKIDRQFLKVQEPLENLRGRQPKYLYVTCTNELVDAAKPGDKVIITGTLEGKIKVTKDGKTPDLDFYLNANSIKKSDKDYENIEISPKEEAFFKELSKRPDIEKLFSSSICPSVFGYEDVKEGIAYQLFGGTQTERSDGTTVRGDIHGLLVGDPGLAKSKLLRYVYGFAPRAVIGSGGSTSGVGLTGAAVKDEFDGRWAIEAGLMTLAGKHGIVCLDEMDKMKPEERAALHTAMEQQSIDVAKGGTFANLPAICGLLGAANPKYGRFDPFDSIASQFNLGDALISRFDFIFVMRDEVNAEFDMKLAMKVLRDEEPENPVMDSECLRKYIAYAKTHFEPKMTDEAINYLAPFYVDTRQAGKGKDTIPITVRTLEAAKRIAAAHARMRLRNEITLEDAKASVAFHMKNLKAVGIDPETGELDAAVLAAGTSNSQLKKIKILKGIIKDLQQKNLSSNTADLEEIKRIAEENGIKDTELLLKRIREKGDVFFPTQTSVKLVK